jgi:hypothetical protein
LCPLGTAATNRPIVPDPDDSDDGEIGGMIDKGNRSTRRKPAPVPLCPPQTPYAARSSVGIIFAKRTTLFAISQIINMAGIIFRLSKVLGESVRGFQLTTGNFFYNQLKKF